RRHGPVPGQTWCSAAQTVCYIRFFPLNYLYDFMKAESVLDTIGQTPHIRFSRMFPGQQQVWIKAERFNPGGSLKDRAALSMIEAAEQSGALKPGATIIEPTSGNTGVGLAMVAAIKGYKLILVMPESMSIERRRL